MKKTLITIVSIICAASMLAACGKKNNETEVSIATTTGPTISSIETETTTERRSQPTSDMSSDIPVTDNTKETEEPAESTERPEETEIETTTEEKNEAGKLYDVGSFSVRFNEDWLFIRMPETAEGGETAIANPNQACFCKYGEDEWDALVNNCVYINYYQRTLNDSFISMIKERYQNCRDFSTTIKDIPCKGFHAVNNDSEFEVIFYPISSSSYFMITIYCNTDSKDVISYVDEDIRMSLETLEE